MKVTIVEARFGDITEYGKTKTEAKNKVMEIAEAFCTGAHEPIIRRMGDFLYIIWRTPESWAYRVIDLQEAEVKFRGYTLLASKKEALRSVEYHVACLLADRGVAIPEIAAMIEGQTEKANFLDYWAWQECFKLTDPALPDEQRRAEADAGRWAFYETNYRQYVTA